MPKMRKSIPAALPEAEDIDIPALAGRCQSGDVRMICVLGPTASGKTGYAVRLAHTLAGDFGMECSIISADSRQVYRGMDIGTGKDLCEYGDIPYYIIDVAEPGDGYNVYRFCEDFAAAFADIRAKGRFPILCGGTGLYINAVCSGYDFRSKKPLSAARPPVAAGGDEGVIASSSPVIASLSPVIAAPSPVIADPSPVIADPDRQSLATATYFIGTLVSREERNARIDARLRARLEEGMVAEVKGLLDAGVPAETLLGYGLEYKFVTLYLQGKLSEEELFTHLSTAIHQFAKRQMTWFRGMERSGIRIHWTRI